MNKNKMKKINIVVVLSVLLALAFGYVIYDVVNDAILVKQAEVYNEGAIYGYELAASEIYRLASACQKVPLTFNNYTIEVVDISCIPAG